MLLSLVDGILSDLNSRITMKQQMKGTVLFLSFERKQTHDTCLSIVLHCERAYGTVDRRGDLVGPRASGHTFNGCYFIFLHPIDLEQWPRCVRFMASGKW